MMRKSVAAKRRLFPAAGLVAALFLLAFILLGAAPPAGAQENSPSACWQPTGPGLPTDLYVRQVVASPNFAADQMLFAATGSNNLNDISLLEGVFVSRDGGKNWRQVLARQRVTVIGVSPDFAQDGVVIAANTGGKVFISQDRGETWQERSIPWNKAWAIAFSPGFRTDKTVFLGGNNGLIVSHDGGFSWEPAGNLQEVRYIAVSPAFTEDNTLFAGCLGYSTAEAETMGVWRSTDGGRSWTRLTSFAEGVKGLAVSPHYPTDRTIYALWSGVLHISRDDGTTWEEVRLPGANASALTISPQYNADGSVFIGTSGLGTAVYDGVFRYQHGFLTQFGCGLLGKDVLNLTVAADSQTTATAASALRLFAAVTMRDWLFGEVYTLTLAGQGQPELVTKEGVVQRGIEYTYWLAVQTEDARYALLEDPAYPEEYAKLKGFLGKKARVTGYLDTGPGFPDPVRGHIRVIKVEPLTEPATGQVLINDPSFVTLTAVPSTAPTAFSLEVRANNPALPVELSYLVLDPNGTPQNPTSGVEAHRDGECETGWASGQHFYHTEIGGWAQYFSLPHYRTCILMLARYEKVYVVFLRENDGQLTYKVLQGGPFTGLDVPGLCKVTRQGSKFEVRSYGGPVEVGLWAKGNYLHDEVAGWALPEFRANPKYYNIPRYGIFMLLVAHYDKLGLIIGNENDGQLGAVCLTGSHDWTAPESVPGLCTVRGLGGPQVEVKATGSDPVEVSHFAFDNSCWQWEVNGWARPEFQPNPQTFALKHYTPGFLVVSRYGKVGIFFYNENNGQLGVLPVEAGPGGGGGQPQEICRFKLGSKSYTAGGKTYRMDVAPYVKNGRSYVSVRYLANAIGVTDIRWDQRTRTVTLKKDDVTLYLTVGLMLLKKQVDAILPMETVPMDVAPEIRNGRVCLPGRWVAEGFGYEVQWDPQGEVIIQNRIGHKVLN